jgi:hypothetical protein
LKLEVINSAFEDTNSSLDIAAKGYETFENILAMGAKLLSSFAKVGF